MSIPAERPLSITAVMAPCSPVQVCAYGPDGPYLFSGPHNGQSPGVSERCCSGEEVSLGSSPTDRDQMVPHFGIYPQSVNLAMLYRYSTGVSILHGHFLEHPASRDVSNVGMVVGDGKGIASNRVLSPAGHSTASFVHRPFEQCLGRSS